MPQPFSSRDEIKRDVLHEWVKKALEWTALHRQTFFSILGTSAIAVIVFLFILSNFRNLQKQAWERYSAGQNWVYAKNPDNAMNFFNDVINNYSRTPAAKYALLAKGDLLYQQKKFSEAVECYKKCLDRNPPKIILPFALSGLGIAQEDSNDFPSAIATYKRFVSDFPDHYLTPKIYESLARVYELSLNPDAAKEVYEKIITMYPGSLWSEKARLHYQKFAPQPFQTSPTPAQPENPSDR